MKIKQNKPEVERHAHSSLQELSLIIQNNRPCPLRPRLLLREDEGPHYKWKVICWYLVKIWSAVMSREKERGLHLAAHM